MNSYVSAEARAAGIARAHSRYEAAAAAYRLAIDVHGFDSPQASKTARTVELRAKDCWREQRRPYVESGTYMSFEGWVEVHP